MKAQIKIKCFQVNSLFLVLILLPLALSGQSYTGKIVDVNNSPVIGATIRLNRCRVYAYSNLSGEFEINISEECSADTLIISCVGFQTLFIPLDQNILNKSLLFVLEERTVVLDEVHISTRKSISREFAVEQFDKLDIYLSPLSNADPLKAISILPFSTNTTESANVELRGSSKEFSRVFINSVPIYNPVRNTRIDGQGNFSILNTELLESEIVYASNPPLKFGNTLAGAVEVKTNEMITEDKFKTSIGLANIGAYYSKIIGKKSFMQVYSNAQFPDAYLYLNKSGTEFLKSFNSYDAGINYRGNLSSSFSVNLYSYLLKERFLSEYSLLNYLGELNSDGFRNFNIFNIAFTKGSFYSKLNVGATFSDSKFTFANYDNDKKEKQYYISFDNQFRLSENSVIQLGVCDDYAHFSFNNIIPSNPLAIYPENETTAYRYRTESHNIETYSYFKLYFGNESSASVGLRKNIPVKEQNSHLSYQMNLRIVPAHNNSMLFSFGKYYGYLMPEGAIYSFRRINSFQLAVDYLYSKEPLSLTFSGYFKKEKQPFYFQEINDIKETNTSILGAEASFDYSLSNFQFSGSSIFLESKGSFDKRNFRSSNDLKYLIRGTVTYMSTKTLNLSIGFTTRPGLYYSPIYGANYNQELGNYIPSFGRINSAQYPNYSTFDVSASKLFSIKGVSTVAFLSLTNVFNRNNYQSIIYSKDYSIQSYKSYMKRLIYFGLTFSFED